MHPVSASIVRVWTIQCPEALEAARERGYLTGARKHTGPVRELAEAEDE